jgi:hypothetical protein
LDHWSLICSHEGMLLSVVKDSKSYLRGGKVLSCNVMSITVTVVVSMKLVHAVTRLLDLVDQVSDINLIARWQLITLQSVCLPCAIKPSIMILIAARGTPQDRPKDQNCIHNVTATLFQDAGSLVRGTPSGRRSGGQGGAAHALSAGSADVASPSAQEGHPPAR